MNTSSEVSPSCAAHPAFEHVRTERVNALNVDVCEYVHKATRARHLHLRSEDDNNAFMVAFLTVPSDSTGVAHILEHTSLCGSERFPVRDPFFMMIRRSLNTFMNAFTSSDWTAYPFASRNVKDFDNLMSIYLDAAFFPSLDPLDFAQEGHRVEFAEPGNADSELVYKGVVFNEMKGAMSSPLSALHQSLHSALFPTVTYHFNSGGDPERIPDLSYADLKAFHARHYHPSNAIFMTYGDLPASHHQQQFDSLALNRFDSQTLDLAVPDEQRYSAPITVSEHFGVDEEDTSAKTYVMLAWLLGLSTDPVEILEGHLLSGVLLGNSASPLRHALETSTLGTAPSPICGLDDSTREASFMCGIEGSEAEHAEAVETLILDVLRDVAENGVDQAQVESELHQLELSQREVGGDSFPYGLQLMVNALTPAIHGADVVAALDIEPLLTGLRESIADPRYIPNLCRKLLLDNPHRVRLVFAPDNELNQRRAASEKAALAALKSTFSEAESDKVIELTRQLEVRQNSEDDPELLPRVTLDDVPAVLKIPTHKNHRSAGMETSWFSQATNGLVYAQAVICLPEFESELRDLLPLFTNVVTEVGCGKHDYQEMQRWQSAVSGGIGASCSVRGPVDTAEPIRAYYSIGGKALSRNLEQLAELLKVTFVSARFDELDRVRELVAQLRAMREAGVTNNGHVLAMMAASAGLSPTAALSHQWGGLEGIRRLKRLDETLNTAAGQTRLSEQLAAINDALRSAPRKLLLIGEVDDEQRLLGAMESEWQSVQMSAAASEFACPVPSGFAGVGWSTNTQVSFCSKAFPTVAQTHADAAALSVLGPFMRNGFLHRVIREQGGAYGGGASYDSDSTSFRFFSYRDPRLDETLADFDASIEWMLSAAHEPRAVEEAILGVVGGIDRPGSPAGEASGTYFATLHGRTPDQRRRYRERILSVSLDDLKRVTESYLRGESANVAVVSSADALRASESELEIQQL